MTLFCLFQNKLIKTLLFWNFCCTFKNFESLPTRWRRVKFHQTTLYLNTYFIIQRTIPRIVSKVGLSSGLSLQHLSINSIRSSGQSRLPIAGLKGGFSLAATRVIISVTKKEFSFNEHFMINFFGKLQINIRSKFSPEKNFYPVVLKTV